MANDNQVLSQADIDSMLKSGPQVQQATPTEEPAALPSSPDPQRASGEAAPPTSALDALQETVSKLAERLDGIDSAIARLGQMEKAAPSQNDAVSKLSERLEGVEAAIARLGKLEKTASSDGSTDAKLAERLQKVEAAIARLGKLEKTASSDGSADAKLAERLQKVETAIGRLDKLEKIASSDGSTDAKLAERLQKVESAIDSLAQMEKTVSDISTAVGLLVKNLEATVKHSQKLGSQVEGMQEELRGTLGYGARDSFQCDRCGSKGLVASPIKCTHCEKESWWGWWSESTRES